MPLSISQEKVATVRDLQTKVSSLVQKVRSGGFYRIIRNKDTIGFLVSPEYIEQIENLEEDLECLKSEYLAKRVAGARADKKKVALEEII